jgi:hypothetical protein
MTAATDTRKKTAVTHHCQSPRWPLPGGNNNRESFCRWDERTPDTGRAKEAECPGASSLWCYINTPASRDRQRKLNES